MGGTLRSRFQQLGQEATGERRAGGPGASEVLLTVPAMGGGVMEKKGLIVKHVTAPPASFDPRGCPASAFSRLPPDSGAAGPCQVLEHPPPGDSRSTRLRPCACLVSKSLSECFASFSTGLF